MYIEACIATVVEFTSN